MTTAKEFREFAAEYLRWSAEVETEEERKAFLDMARDWTLAALRAEDRSTPVAEEKPPSPQHP